MSKLDKTTVQVLGVIGVLAVALFGLPHGNGNGDGYVGYNHISIPGQWDVGMDKSVLDYNVVHTAGKPSLRQDKGITEAMGADNNLLEINSAWMPRPPYAALKPGDRIIMRVWCKVDSCTPWLPKNPKRNGAIVGFDLYGEYSRLWEVHPEAEQTQIWKYVPSSSAPASEKMTNYNPIYVPFGNDWTLLTIDVTLPNKEYYKNDYYQDLPNAPQHAIGLIPWLTLTWRDAGAQTVLIPSPATVWFADPELYINPSFMFVQTLTVPEQ